jgi:hypothetical protein
MYAAISSSSLASGVTAVTGGKIASIGQGCANANHFSALGYTSCSAATEPSGEVILDLSRGTSIAFAVSALLAASGCTNGSGEATNGTTQSIECDDGKVCRCEGGNACRGLSECATLDGKSSCVGENECKGTGYVYTQTKEQCEALQIKNRP